MNSCSPVWEDIFRNRSSWNKYPPEELIRFFARHFYSASKRSEVKVLEVGCGPGAGSSQFVSREGFSFFGVDGSPTAIEKAKATFDEQGLQGKFDVSGIDDLPYPNEFFDCVIDVCCLQCNSEAQTAKALREIHRVLKYGGRHFSLTVRSGTWGESTGTRVDETSRKDLTEGPFVGMDVQRFSTETSLKKLYQQFKIEELDFSVRSIDGQKHEIGHWMVSALKPSAEGKI